MKPGTRLPSISSFLCFTVIATIAIILRLQTTYWEPVIAYGDTTQYLSLAKEIKSLAYFSSGYDLDKGFLLSRKLAPLYSTLVALLSLLPIKIEYAAIVVSLCMSMLTLLPVFFLANRLASPLAAWCAAAIFAFHPFVLLYATPGLTESTFTFFYILAFALAIYGFTHGGTKIWIVIGCIAALAYLTREVGCILLPMLCLLVVLHFVSSSMFSQKSLAKALILLNIGFWVTSLPYLLMIKDRTGEFSFTARGGHAAISQAITSYGGDRGERDRIPDFYADKAKEEGKSLVKETVSWPERLGRKIFLTGFAYFKEFVTAFGLAATFLALLALLQAMRTKLPALREPRLFHGYIFLWMLQLPASYGLVSAYMVDNRYMYPLAGLGCVLTGIAIASIAEVLGKSVEKLRSLRPGIQVGLSFVRRVAALLVIIALFIGYLPSIQNTYLRAQKSIAYSAGHKQVAEYLQHQLHLPSGLRVMSRNPFLAYYLDGKMVLLPKSYKELFTMIDNRRRIFFSPTVTH